LAISAEIEKRNRRHDQIESSVEGTPGTPVPRLESKITQASLSKNSPNEPPPPSMADGSEEGADEDELEWLPEEVDVLDMEDYYNLEGAGEREWDEEENSVLEESEIEDEPPSVAQSLGRDHGEE